MVPGVRIEVTAIRIAGAITTDGGIGIATLKAAWQCVQSAAPYFTVYKELLKKEA
jgi:hypothetical protein